MPLWPFGRGKEPKDVEFMSRVVTATSRDGARLRGKVTLHFESPQTQRDAEEAIDRGASAAVQALADTQQHQELLGDDSPEAVEALVTRVREQIAANVPPLRALEVAAIHVVGDLSTTASRAIGRLDGGLGGTPVGTPVPTPAAGTPKATSGSGTHPTPQPSRRPSSSQMLSATGERLVAAGSSPAEAGRSIAPLVKDTAVRLLVGLLRAYDVLAVRNLVLDEESSDMMVNLVPTSDVALGHFEERRADELSRWVGVLGAEKVTSLRRESSIVASYLLYAALLQIGVGVAATVQVIEAASAAAFPSDRSPLVDMSRYLHAAEGTRQELAASVLRTVGKKPGLEALEDALEPLVSTLSDDMGLAAAQIKNSLR